VPSSRRPRTDRSLSPVIRQFLKYVSVRSPDDSSPSLRVCEHSLSAEKSRQVVGGSVTVRPRLRFPTFSTTTSTRLRRRLKIPATRSRARVPDSARRRHCPSTLRCPSRSRSGSTKSRCWIRWRSSRRTGATCLCEATRRAMGLT
jgi:hypothetical protein